METSNSLVSIIIPAFNIEKYISQSINSMVNQTYHNLEIIVVDDGSTDSTASIVKALALNEKRIRYIYEKNSGLSVARNSGLEIANGEFVYFFDGDDLFSTDGIKKLVDLSEKINIPVIRFGAYSFPKAEKLNEKFEIPISIHEKQSVSINKYIENPSTVRVPVWLYFFRRKFLKDNNLNFFPNILHEDELFTPLVLLRIDRIGILDEKLFHRRIRKNSIMNRSDNLKIKGRNLIFISDFLNYIL
ncbi:glycosyltransferase, partial [Oenococcus oeni]|uniref:glycosyltransferase n=2 Tax=Oenococcus oeni TaxID=1247 RepID=UPI0008F8EDFF